jgi:hypothetical protein
MNPLIQLKQITLVLFIALGVSSATLAVTPTPDGGYPGGNTAEGQNALLSLTTGRYNTAVGFLSLEVNTTNNFNTAIGAGALFVNAADGNTATGAAALLSNTSGVGNTANGSFALSSNTTGNHNTAIGNGALQNTTTTGGNTAIGHSALANNSTGELNTATGASALLSNTTGSANTVTGNGVLEGNTTGNHNTAMGTVALGNNTTGSNNVAVGDTAGQNVITASNVICIGSVGADVSNSCYIGQIFGVTSSGGAAVFINSSGQLGTTTSSKRFKEEIKPMDKASEVLLALKPVTFRYKKELDPQGIQQWGLVAEDVQRVNSALVALDKDGRPYSVRYDQVNAMLLNEFLKTHRKLEEQGAMIDRQQKQIEALTAGLQKVSAQLEASKSVTQVADSKY